MNTHKNARLTIHSRQVLVHRVIEQGLRPVDVAQAMAVSPRTVYKWLARYRNEGWTGLSDRSCRPHRCPHRTSAAQQARIRRLRRQRRIYSAITRQTGVPRATVARVLQRAGLNRLSALEPSPPVRRYEHDAPGDLLHLDIKK
ncbi:transposase [Salinisphaera hydrothermalis C27AD]